MTTCIGLIDYGMGNLHSVQQAFLRLDAPLKIVSNPNDLKGCDALVLPGVGAFDPATENLKRTKLIPHLKEWVLDQKPLLGICLGLQLLFEYSEEGNTEGLGVFKGKVYKLPSNQKERIPHMGWAPLISKQPNPLLDKSNVNSWMYFVHSYAAIPTNSDNIAATTLFGSKEITAIIWSKKVGACQFHPEKSSKAGNLMLNRWIKWLKDGAPEIL